MIKLKNILNEQTGLDSDSAAANAYPGLEDALKKFAGIDLNNALKNMPITIQSTSKGTVSRKITNVWNDFVMMFWNDNATDNIVRFDYSNAGGGAGPLYRTPIGPMTFYFDIEGLDASGKVEIYFLNYKPVRIGEVSINDENYSIFSEYTNQRILASIKNLSFEKYIPTLPIINAISSTLKSSKSSLRWIADKQSYNHCEWNAQQGRIDYRISFDPGLYRDKNNRPVIDVCISDDKGDCTVKHANVSLNTSLNNAMANLAKTIA